MSGLLHSNIYNASRKLQIAINIFLSIKTISLSLYTVQVANERRVLSSHIIFRMRYVAAYLLAALSGNNSPSADDLKKIIGSVGIDCEADKITKIIGELKGKNIEELITKG